MNRFEYIRPATVADAIAALNEPASRALAGGTNLVDLMKYDVAQPPRLVDINRLPLHSNRSKSLPVERCASARWSLIAIWRGIQTFGKSGQCCRAPFLPVRRHSCGTRPQPEEI